MQVVIARNYARPENMVNDTDPSFYFAHVRIHFRGVIFLVNRRSTATFNTNPLCVVSQRANAKS